MSSKLAEMAKGMPQVLVLKDWSSSATRYPEKQYGSVRIKKIKYKDGMYNMYGVDGYRYFILENPVEITTLQEKKGKTWKTWMVDDPPHFFSMQNYARESMGKVLVAGVGLGMLIEALEKNPMVKEITAVEINSDVMGLIKSLIKTEKTFFVHDDFYKYLDMYTSDYDTVICDIWTSGSLEETKKLLETEILPLNKKLKEKFPGAKLIYHGFGKVE